MDEYIKREPQTTGQIIQHHREAAQLSLQQLAAKLAITCEVLQAWESDSVTPAPNEMEKLASAFSTKSQVFKP